MDTFSQPSRWATLTLALVGAATGSLGYLAGRFEEARTTRLPAVAMTQVAPAMSRTSASAGWEETGGKMSLATDAPGDWDERWHRLATDGRPPATERKMAVMLSELATRDPRRAMAMALAEKNWRLRVVLRNAVLRGWASAAPRAAAEWVMKRSEAERPEAMAAVFSGAAGTPIIAAELGSSLCAEDPARAADYGGALIASLAEAGEFKAAVAFVRDGAATPLRLEQLNAVFMAWARHDPTEAAQAVNALGESSLREEAWRGVAVGWAEADPIGLANYAAQQPAGEGRAQALANALPRWIERDPVAASEWLAQHDSDPDFDMGVIAMASLPSMIEQRPAVAMSLAESIADVPLRMNTLRTLVLKWSERDAAAARGYVGGSAAFKPADRESILREISATSHD